MTLTRPYRSIATFLLTLLGTFLINIELTAVNLGLSKIAQDFSVPISKTSGILSFYLIFFAVFTVVGGKLGDLFGRKKITVLMLLVFILASLIGGCTHTYYWLLIARGLQGLSAGAMLPNYTAILYENVPVEKKHSIIGIISAVVGFATAAGPLIGAYIINYSNWRYIFFVNIPIGLLILFGLVFFLKEVSKHNYQAIDYIGLILTTLMILVLVKLIDIIPIATFLNDALFLSLFFILFYFWLVRHLKAQNPFLSLSLFKKKTYTIGCFIRMFLGFSYYIILYILGIFSQQVLHFSAVMAGFVYLPMTLSVTISSLLYGKISSKFNLIVVLRAGLLLFFLGILILSYNLKMVPILIFSLIIIGCAYGILYSSLFSLTLHGVSNNNTSEASGALYFFNLLGGSIGVSFTGVIFEVIKNKPLEETLLFGVQNMLMACASIIAMCCLVAFFIIKKAILYSSHVNYE